MKCCFTSAVLLLGILGGGDVLAANTSVSAEPLGPSSRRGAMVISEIMVDAPAAWGGTNSLEFVELYNSGLITEDLTGHRFSGEIDFTFPDGTMLAPGAFLVVAKDPAAAQSFYGVSFLGPYAGKLANSGGMLRFRNELDGILLEINYDNRAPWPVAAFGTGHSLVLSHPSYGENDPRAWSASDQIGGSPGADESMGSEPARGVVINEYLAHTDLPQVDYIELFNTTASPVDLSGAWLSDAAGTNKFQIAAGTSIPARGFLSFDQNMIGFALSADGESIFLVNSNQTRVLDAVSFRGQANGVSEGRYPDGAPEFQRLSSVSKGAANASPLLSTVVINEIMYHPVSESDDDEYVELYNRSGSAVDLSGWSLQGGISYRFPEGVEIPAHGYVVVAENAANLIGKYPQLNASNTYGNYGGTLGNGGDTLRLAMPDDLVSTNAVGLTVTNFFQIPVDEVTYLDGGRWGEWSDGGGSSLELIDPDADNRQLASWADSDESAKAPWTTIDVTEILENGQYSVDEGPAYANTSSEVDRLELFLQGAGEVLIDDVEFRNNGGGNDVDNGTFSSGSSSWGWGGVVRNSYVESGVGTGGSAALHLVSVARGDTGCNKAYNDLSSTPSLSGSNTGTIRAKVRWLKGAKQILLRLRGNWMEICQELEVPTQCGTPGQANSRLMANAGPAIYDVSHSPVLPASGASVVVTARAVDPDGVSAIALGYRVDPSTTYSSLFMNDGGTGGDAVAGDGIYSATLPGQTSGKLVAFHVVAVDGSGSASTTFPAAVPEHECLIRWGESDIAGGIGTYRLWVTSANLSLWGSREKNANDTLDATFVYGDDRVIYNVATMYSASPFHTPAYDGPIGSFACDYEINFHPGERFLGSEPFVLNAEDDNGNWWFDSTTQNDLAGTWIARRLGQQYNYRRHVHMMVNGNERGSVYLDTQQPNSEMLDEYFPNDSQSELRKIEGWFEFADNFTDQGSVYARLGQVNKSSGGIDPKWYRWAWRPRATKDHNNWFNFTNLVAAVNDAGAINREERVRTWMNVHDFFRPIVTHHICGSWDSYGYSRGKNMYAFKPDNEGWRLLMWDIEICFAKGDSATANNLYTSVDSSLFDMMQAIPSIHREYLAAYQDAVDNVLLSSLIDPILDERYTNLVANGISVSSPSSIKNYISSRRTYLQSILPSAGFEVDGSGSYTVSTNSIELSGTAPLQVAEIGVNGIAYPVEWTSTTAWRLTVPLSAGLNSLSLTGVDRQGNAVSGASASLSVTYSGADPDPEGVVVISEIHPSPEDRDLQFLELHNLSDSAVFDLSGWRLNGIGYTFPTGSVIRAGAYLVLAKDRYRFADRYPAATLFDVYGGSLDSQGETLTLFRPGTLPDDEIVVDRVRYETSAPWADSSGGSSLQLIDPLRDNARVANWGRSEAVPAALPIDVLDFAHTWKYQDDGVDLGTSWREPGFDDSSWAEGPGLLYYEEADLPAPKSTLLNLATGKMTYYFRSTFTYTGDLEGASLKISTVLDDGMVLYLNGQEIYRLGMGAGTVSYSTLSSRVVGDAAIEGPFTLPATALQNGVNELAVEVHQAATSSSDVVFGMTLDVVSESQQGASPGSANYVADTLPAFPDVWLNELQAGDNDPWVELYNGSTSAFNLEGYYLTDDYGSLTKWAFPAGTTVPAGGFLVVWCDAEPGESAPGSPHAAFRLPSYSGQVGLVRMVADSPQVVDYLSYTNLPLDHSYGDVPDGQPFYRSELFYATPGAANNAAAPPITVSINEWMADNNGTLADPADGQYDDWFELYNPGSTTVDLGGYFLTDTFADPFKFEIPANGQYTLEPGGYLLVWADNDAGQNSTNRPDLHVNFSLSKNGEAIAVYAADGSVIDSVTFGVQSMDVSEGRVPDGTAGISTLDTPSPRGANQAQSAPPVLEDLAVDGADIRFSWLSVSGLQYQVYGKEDLTEAVWSPLGNLLSGTGGMLSWTNSITNSPHQFYGIGLEP